LTFFRHACSPDSLVVRLERSIPTWSGYGHFVGNDLFYVDGSDTTKFVCDIKKPLEARSVSSGVWVGRNRVGLVHSTWVWSGTGLIRLGEIGDEDFRGQ
jgi:hypothetical protein